MYSIAGEEQLGGNRWYILRSPPWVRKRLVCLISVALTAVKRSQALPLQTIALRYLHRFCCELSGGPESLINNLNPDLLGNFSILANGLLVSRM